jgi:hypothetical protein
MMLSERKGLRANASSDIDNQRTLGKVFPGVPYKFDFPKVRWWYTMNAVQRDQTFQDGIRRHAFFMPFMAAPNRMSCDLLSGRSNQLHITSLVL